MAPLRTELDRSLWPRAPGLLGDGLPRGRMHKEAFRWTMIKLAGGLTAALDR